MPYVYDDLAKKNKKQKKFYKKNKRKGKFCPSFFLLCFYNKGKYNSVLPRTLLSRVRENRYRSSLKSRKTVLFAGSFRGLHQTRTIAYIGSDACNTSRKEPIYEQ